MKASLLIASVIFVMSLGTVQAADEETTIQATPTILSGVTKDEAQQVKKEEMKETKGTGPGGYSPPSGG